MRSRALIFAWLVGALIVVESACGGGTQTAPPPPPPPPKSTVSTPTVLRTLYRVFNGTDRMSTVGPNERTWYPLEAQVYYVPDQAASGRSTLSRVVNSSGSDHAGTIAGLSGYSQDMELGFPWSVGTTAGVAQLDEAFNRASGDYALLAPSKNLPGYVPQPLAGYGYPRYGNAAEALLSLSGGGVTVQSNAVAGGSTDLALVLEHSMTFRRLSENIPPGYHPPCMGNESQTSWNPLAGLRIKRIGVSRLVVIPEDELSRSVPG